MSPEQFDGEREADRRADVYALGVMLFELLAGRLPVEVRGVPLAEVARRVREVEPPALGNLVPACRGDVETVVAHALEKPPERRYATVADLAADLRRHLADEPIRARRPSRAYRARKLARRHRATLVGVGVTLVLAALLSAALVQRAVEARRQTRAVEAAAETARLVTRAERYEGLVGRASAAIDGHQLALADRLLDAAADRGRPGDPDLRGWEWQYLKRRANPPARVGWQPGVTNRLAVSPDGRRAAVSSLDGHARVWALDETGDALREVARLAGHDGELVALCWTPDGRHVVTSGWDTKTVVWDGATGARRPADLADDDAPTVSLAAGPADALLASAVIDEGVRIVDRATGATRLQLPIPRMRPSALAASAGRVAVATNDRITVFAIDAADPAAPRVVGAPVELSMPFGYTAELAFSPDGQRLVAAHSDNLARVWDVEAGRALFDLPGHTNRVVAAAWSADGAQIATGCEDGAARVFDAEAGAPLGARAGHDAPVTGVAFAHDGALVTAGRDGTVRRWAEAGSAAVRVDQVARGPRNTLTTLDVVPGARLAVGDLTGQLALLDADAPGPATRPAHRAAITSSAVSPDGAQLATGGLDRLVKLWPTSDPAAKPVVLMGHTMYLRAVAYAPDGRTLVSGGQDQTLRAWDAMTGKPIGKPQQSPWRRGVTALAFAPGGRALAHGSDQGHVALADDFARLDAPRWVAQLRGGATSFGVNALDFAPDGGALLAACTDERHVALLDARDGRVARTLDGHSGAVTSVRFHPGGRRVATSSADGTVRVWNADTGGELVALRADPPAAFTDVAWVDDATLAATTRDGRVLRWSAR